MNENHLLKEHLETMFYKNTRFDGRKLDELRKMELESNNSSTAEGSARIKMGETEVIAGVKLDIGEP